MNNLRFISPVLSGRRVRGHFSLKSVLDKGQGRYQLVLEVMVEIEHQEKPALVTEWLTLIHF